MLGRFEDAIKTYDFAFMKDLNDQQSSKNFLNSFPKATASPGIRWNRSLNESLNQTPNLFSKESISVPVKIELVEVDETSDDASVRDLITANQTSLNYNKTEFIPKTTFDLGSAIIEKNETNLYEQ